MKRHWKKWVAACAGMLGLLGTVGTGALAGASAGPSVPAALGALERVTASLLPGLDHALSEGAADPTTRLTVDFGIQDPSSGAESSLLDALYNPKSPEYHQFLTPSQFDNEFRVPRATDLAVEAWLRSGGLQVSYVSGAGDLVAVRGTVSELGSLLDTTFGSYSIGGINFVANQSAPAVPSNLSIYAISGLNTLQRVWTSSELAQLNHTTASSSSPDTSGTKSVVPAAASGYVGTDVPQDLWGVYDQPSSDEGQGETAGIFAAGYPGSIVPDLRVYEERMDLPAVPTRFVLESQVTNPSVPSDNDVFGDDEWNNDIDALTGMAPKLSRVDMYFASTELDADTAIMFSDWANDPQGPTQMNASFSECESDPTSRLNPPQTPLDFGLVYGAPLQLISDHSLEQAVLEGRTLFASAGDTAGSCPEVILPVLGGGNGIIPQPLATDQGYPCVSVYAVCVGGTVVTTNGTTNPSAVDAPASDLTTHPARVAEQAWLYTGGGPAANVPKPSYQDGVGAVNKPCTEPEEPDGTPIPLGTTCRGVPDVAALSGSGLVDGELVGNNAYEDNIDMLPTPGGGTSVSSPLIVGMWSRIQAASPPNNQGQYDGLGFANYTFYAVGKGQLGDAARDFYDITSGELPLGNVYELPAKGWDYTSGWGALDVSNFIKDVDHDPSLRPTHASSNADYVSYFPQVSCSAALAGPVGNAYDSVLSLTSNVNDPQLNITSATLARSADGKDLVATISGPGLATTGPLDALDGYNFYLTWNYNGTTYFAGAEVDPPAPLPKTPLTNSIPAPVSLPTGTVVYGDGTMNTDSPAFAHTDAGSFSDHTFTITVPLANVGNPPTGSLLLFPFAFDTLPIAIFVPSASDEVVAGITGPGQAVKLGNGC